MSGIMVIIVDKKTHHRETGITNDTLVSRGTRQRAMQ